MKCIVYTDHAQFNQSHWLSVATRTNRMDAKKMLISHQFYGVMSWSKFLNLILIDGVG